MSPLGLIVNPASGRDIRRLVAEAWVVTHQEKIAITARLLCGLRAAGATQVLYMPEPRGICVEAAARVADAGPALTALPMDVSGTQADSTTAARLLSEAGAACIVTLGGDGTNRAVFKGCGPGMPLLPISTGTNNVFPEFHEGTTAGYAAGLLAAGLLAAGLPAAGLPAAGRAAVGAVFRRHKVLHLWRGDGAGTPDDNPRPAPNKLTNTETRTAPDGAPDTAPEPAPDTAPDDMALVDLAVASDTFIAARALWEATHVRELFLTRARPDSVGLSAIGGCVQPTSADAPHGLWLTLGTAAGAGGRRVLAPIAPGRYEAVDVAAVQTLTPGRAVRLTLAAPATLALDGERDLTARAGETLTVALSLAGPLVLDVPAVLNLAAREA